MTTIADLHSREAEEATLGSCLIDPDAIIEVRLILPKKEAFYLSGNRRIYEAMLSLSNEHKPIDPVTLSEWVKLKYNMDILGDVVKLLNAVPTSINACTYAEQVKGWHTRREIVKTSGEMATAAYNTNEYTADDALSRSVELVSDLSTGQSGDDGYMGAYDASVMLVDYQQNDQADMGLKWPLPSFQKALGNAERGESYWFVGVDKSGKSMATTSISLGWAKMGFNVVRFGLEMTKRKRHMRDMANLTGIAYNKIKNKTMDVDEFEIFMHYVGRYSELNLHTFHKPAITASWMRQQLNRVKARHGKIDVIEIDYFQLMDIENDKRMGNKTEKFDYIAEQIRAITLDFDCVVIPVAQLNGKSIAQRQDKRPTRDDIYGTNAPNKMAGAIFGIYRDGQYNPDTTDTPNIMEFNSLVSRDVEHQFIRMYFDGACSRVMELQNQELRL